MREGVRDRTELQHIDPPLLWPSTLCLSCSPVLLNRRPGGSAFCWLSLPHLVSNSSGPQLTDFLSPPSYIIVQFPLNLWNGMFDCHQVEITVMQFTRHSLPVHQSECTMGFLPCPIFLAPSAYAISSHNCHQNVSLPSGASLWNGMFTTPMISKPQ